MNRFTRVFISALRSGGARGVLIAALAALPAAVFADGPPAGSQIWESDVVSGKRTQHEKFLITRRGAQITGYYEHEPEVPQLGNLDEIGGTVGDDGSFRISTDNGVVWRGRFVGQEVVDGKKFDKEAFHLRFIRNAETADFPPRLPPTTSDWQLFFVRFRTAVKERDRSSLKVMIGRTFELQGAILRTKDDVLAKLNWKDFEKALLTGTVRSRVSALGHKEMTVFDAHPCPKCVYGVLIVFHQDSDNQWRWIAVVYPGD